MATLADLALDSPRPAASAGAVWRLPAALILAGVGLFALSMWLFWDGLTQMWGWWLDLPEYSYALLIPPVSGFLIWQQKDRLEQISFAGSWWGAGVVLLGGGMLLLGQLGTVYTLVQYAYVVTLLGLALALTGTAAFRLLLMPLLILFLMVPLPQFALANLSTKLQLLSSQLGVGLIGLFDISVFLEGNVIDLGGYKLEVAEACSGLRYLFPLMTMGFLMAYFYKAARWKRVVLFFSSIPLTVLMNGFRVGIIGITVDRWGIGMAEGFLHEFQGWMVFMVCAALMLAEIGLLNRLGRESGTWRELFGVEFPAPTPKGALIRRRPVPTSFVAAGVLLVAFAGVTLVVPRPTEVHPARAVFAEFPLQFGAWRGKTQSLEAVYDQALQLDDYLLADFVDGSGGQGINLYVSWYDSQRKGEAVHSPRACIPGGGWQMQGFGQRELRQVTINGRPLRVNRTLIEQGNERQLVYYWFQQRGRIITNEFLVKWFIFWDALIKHRTDGAMVRLVTALPPGGTVADADGRLTEFAGRIAGELPRFVPN
jgi:exosortase D (VPLPA-CTERM-specific)